MPAPTDPFPNFVPHAGALADQVDARFSTLYKALDRGQVGGGLDPASIKDGIVVPALTVVDAYQSVALGNGLAGFTLEFYKDLMGLVRIKRKPYIPGVAVTVTAGGTFCTIPSGFRPGILSHGRWEYFNPPTNASGYGWFSIDTSGVMVAGPGVTTPTTAHIILQGAWKAEN